MNMDWIDIKYNYHKNIAKRSNIAKSKRVYVLISDRMAAEVPILQLFVEVLVILI